MSNTAPSRADPVVVFPLSQWCPPQKTSQPHPAQGNVKRFLILILVSKLLIQDLKQHFLEPRGQWVSWSTLIFSPNSLPVLILLSLDSYGDRFTAVFLLSTVPSALYMRTGVIVWKNWLLQKKFTTLPSYQLPSSGDQTPWSSSFSICITVKSLI